MKILSRVTSVILALILMLTQVSEVSALTMPNDSCNENDEFSSINITDISVLDSNDTDLYYDASQDTLLEDIKENEKYFQQGEHHVRASSKDKVIPEDSLPSSINISTSKHIPPINNQGYIGCCASMGTVYMQFTNAISRYIEKNNMDDNWNPKQNSSNRFAPKWSYNFVKSTVSDIYKVLAQNGAVTEDKCDFSPLRRLTDQDTVSWQLEGMYDALKYRLVSDEAQDTYAMWKYSYQMTTTDAGKELFNRIKSAVVQGNVVTANCYMDDMVYAKVTKAGDIGKVGEYAIVAGAGEKTGYHQMSIVGYDDNIQAVYNSQTLTGAFLVANSHGTSYRNKGFIWVMYDSLNKKSANSNLNDASIYASPMNITIDNQDLAVYSPSYFTESSNWDFKDVGTAVVNGKSYTTYTIGRYSNLDGSVGPYISYNNDNSDNVVLTNYATRHSNWCLIPYEDIIKWSNFDDANYDDKYLGTHWLYAVNKVTKTPMFLNSGTNLALQGSKLKLSKFDKGIPETKSFVLPEINKSGSGNFNTKIIVDETIPEAADRHEVFDWYYITYWDSDVVVQNPNMILGVTIKSYGQHDFKIKPYNKRLIRETITPVIYEASTDKPFSGYSFSGLQSSTLTEPEEATMYFSLDRLGVLDGQTYEDYSWGAKIECDSQSGHAVVVTGLKVICGRNGKTLGGGNFVTPVTIKDGKDSLIGYDISAYPKFDTSTKPTVKATASETQIDVSWSKVDNATGYNLYRKASNETEFKLIKNCKSNYMNRYVDTNCSPDLTYQYAVKAYSVLYGKTTNGTQSDPTTAIRLSITVGETQITSIYETETGIYLTWSKATNANGYAIYHKTNSKAWTLVKDVTGTSFTDTTAPKDIYCYYQVRPYNRIGDVNTYGVYNNSGSKAYLHSHVEGFFKAGDKVTLKSNAIMPNAHQITGKALGLDYIIESVDGHFLNIGIRITKAYLEELEITSVSDLLMMYGFTTKDYFTMQSIIDSGLRYNFVFKISSACCNKKWTVDTDTDIHITDTDTSTDTTTDTATDSDTVIDTTTDTVTDSDTVIDTTTDTVTDSDTTTDTQTDTETKSDTETDTTTDTVIDSDTETDTTTDTVIDSDTETDTSTDTDYGFKSGDEVNLTLDAENIDGWFISKSVLELDYKVLLIKDDIATLVLNVDKDYLEELNMDLGELFTALGYLNFESEDSSLNYDYLSGLISSGQEVSLTFKVHCSHLVSQENTDVVYGDANCDGEIDMVDVVTIQKIIAKLVDYANYGENSESNCDCDRDGIVTMSDVTLLQRYLAKLVQAL